MKRLETSMRFWTQRTQSQKEMDGLALFLCGAAIGALLLTLAALALVGGNGVLS